jgi:hypothetical protein
VRWQGPAAIVNIRLLLSAVRVLNKDYERQSSVEEKLLVVSLKGLGPKAN